MSQTQQNTNPRRNNNGGGHQFNSGMLTSGTVMHLPCGMSVIVAPIVEVGSQLNPVTGRLDSVLYRAEVICQPGSKSKWDPYPTQGQRIEALYGDPGTAHVGTLLSHTAEEAVLGFKHQAATLVVIVTPWTVQTMLYPAQPATAPGRDLTGAAAMMHGMTIPYYKPEYARDVLMLNHTSMEMRRLIESAFDGVRCVTRMPEEAEFLLPFLQVVEQQVVQVARDFNVPTNALGALMSLFTGPLRQATEKRWLTRVEFGPSGKPTGVAWGDQTTPPMWDPITEAEVLTYLRNPHIAESNAPVFEAARATAETRREAAKVREAEDRAAGIRAALAEAEAKAAEKEAKRQLAIAAREAEVAAKLRAARATAQIDMLACMDNLELLPFGWDSNEMRTFAMGNAENEMGIPEDVYTQLLAEFSSGEEPAVVEAAVVEAAVVEAAVVEAAVTRPAEPLMAWWSENWTDAAQTIGFTTQQCIAAADRLKEVADAIEEMDAEFAAGEEPVEAYLEHGVTTVKAALRGIYNTVSNNPAVALVEVPVAVA